MTNSSLKFLDGGGEMGERIRSHNWAATPLGPPERWHQSLRTVVALMIRTSQPTYLAWGPHQISLYNDAYIPIVGTKHPASLGQPACELWAEIWGTLGPLNEAVLNGESLYFEDMQFALGGRDQELSWFSFSYTPLLDDNSKVAGIYCVAIETTDKVLALARHRDAEERYRLSLEAGHMGTWSVDHDTGVTMMDERFASLFGVAPDVAERGASLEYFTQIIHPDDRGNVIAAVSQAMQNDAAYDIHYRTVPEVDKTVWVSAKGQMFVDLQSGKRRFAGVATDITSRKEAEIALRDADRRKDEFLAMLAHELRNPLAPISAAATLLRMRTLDPKRLAVTSEVIGRQVAHMTNLIDDLLDVSRVTRGLVTLDIAEEPLGGIINDAIEQATPLIRAKGQRISLQLEPEPVLVSGDKKRLVQALSNILNNATKYTPDNGHILLATTVKDACVQIDVTDDGIGIDPAFTSRAFELFSQAERSSDRASGGLGLGLALVKSLVELHHGTVSAFSAGIGKGSTFSLILPCLLEREVKQGGTHYDDAARQGMSPLRIMIVDDNQDAALMMAMLLEAARHEVIVKHSAKAALAHSTVPQPDVFLLDIGLPEMDGNTLARHLRAHTETASAVLIAVTGYGQEHDRKATRAAGFDHHLVKPLDSDHLLRLLADIAQEKR